jgi:electron transfer flavoprotein beta subunit
LKIVVYVKTVPDSAAAPAILNGTLDWGSAPLVLNPWVEFAVEAALRQKEAQGGSLTAVSVGDVFEIVPALIAALKARQAR